MAGTGSENNDTDKAQADRAAIEKLVADEVARQTAANSPASFRGFWLAFPTSGLFFMLLGGTLLFVANWQMAKLHAAFTFVLVVLGIAILLYGTGTRSAASFSSEATAARYNIAIAGGAGVLALCVGYGMVNYYPQMVSAFQVERKYVRVVLESADGTSKLSKYTSHFTVDDLPVPTVLRDRTTEILIPYTIFDVSQIDADERSTAQQVLSSIKSGRSAPKPQPATNQRKRIGCPSDQRGMTGATAASGPVENEVDDSSGSIRKKVSGKFYLLPDAAARTQIEQEFASLNPKVETEFTITIGRSSLEEIDGWRDFPRYKNTFCVDLKNERQASSIAATTETRANVADLSNLGLRDAPPTRALKSDPGKPGLVLQ